MNDLEKHLHEISIMDEDAIMFAAHNLRKNRRKNYGHFEQVRDAINQRLQIYGYTLYPGCCGNFTVRQITQE